MCRLTRSNDWFIDALKCTHATLPYVSACILVLVVVAGGYALVGGGAGGGSGGGGGRGERYVKLGAMVANDSSPNFLDMGEMGEVNLQS